MNTVCKLDGWRPAGWWRRLMGLAILLHAFVSANIGWAQGLDQHNNLPALLWPYALGATATVIVCVVIAGRVVRGMPWHRLLVDPVAIGGILLLSAGLSIILAYYVTYRPQAMVERAVVQSTNSPTGETRLVQTTMPPGITFERCLTLTPDETLSYQFQADQPLVFDIHYHAQDVRHYVIEEHAAQREKRTYTPPATQLYCLTWQNPTSAPVLFSWAFAKTTSTSDAPLKR